jgi:hypothetical protein
MKVLTDRYFMFVSRGREADALPLKTALDTLRAYQISGGRAHHHERATYTEHLDIFVIPSWIGTSFRATCRIEGGLWYHSFTEPNDTTAGPYQHFIEVWRRIE